MHYGYRHCDKCNQICLYHTNMQFFKKVKFVKEDSVKKALTLNYF